MLIKPNLQTKPFDLSFVEFEIKLLGEFCIQILMLSHCWVHLVQYIVVQVHEPKQIEFNLYALKADGS